MSSSDDDAPPPDLSEDPDEPPPRTLDERVIDIIVRTTNNRFTLHAVFGFELPFLC